MGKQTQTTNKFKQRLNFFWTQGPENINQCVTSQDGTGVAQLNFFGQDNGLSSSFGMWVDTESQYDGIYMPRPLTTDENPTNKYMIYFVSHDSDGGILKLWYNYKCGLDEDEEKTAGVYALEQNTPNPFNPTTTIGFTLANAGNVNIDVFNVAGQKVDTLVNDFMEAGSNSVVWDASEFSAGVYFYTVKSGNFTKTLKMTLLK